MATSKISIRDFIFVHQGYGLYLVTYTSPVTGYVWKTLTRDMLLIDATKNSENPKIKDLNTLKSLCKQGKRIL